MDETRNKSRSGADRFMKYTSYKPTLRCNNCNYAPQNGSQKVRTCPVSTSNRKKFFRFTIDISRRYDKRVAKLPFEIPYEQVFGDNMDNYNGHDFMPNQLKVLKHLVEVKVGHYYNVENIIDLPGFQDSASGAYYGPRKTPMVVNGRVVVGRARRQMEWDAFKLHHEPRTSDPTKEH